MESAKYYIARLHARERAAATRERNERLKASLRCCTVLTGDWHVEPVSPSVSLSAADSNSLYERERSHSWSGISLDSAFESQSPVLSETTAAPATPFETNTSPTDLKLPSAPTGFPAEEERGRSRTREPVLVPA